LAGRVAQAALAIEGLAERTDWWRRRFGEIGQKLGRGTAMDLINMSENDKRGGTTEGPNTGVVVKARPKTRKPAMYKVLMLNDDYTPMEFVVHVLERFFQKNREEATRIMLHVHRRGVGVCGVFTYEVAETKVTQVMDLARQNQHPLQCTIEKE
jgi:ATP-dependent Clp protease adaptor protein ClpS